MEFVVIALLIVAAVSLIWAQWLRPRDGKTKRQTRPAKGNQAAAKSTYQPTFDTPRGDAGGRRRHLPSRSPAPSPEAAKQRNAWPATCPPW